MQPNIIPIKQRIEDNSIPITKSGCWIWIYGKTSRGYGTLKINGKQIYARKRRKLLQPIEHGEFV